MHFFLSGVSEELNVQTNSVKIELTFLFKLTVLPAVTPLLSVKISVRIPVTLYQVLGKKSMPHS